MTHNYKIIIRENIRILTVNNGKRTLLSNALTQKEKRGAYFMDKEIGVGGEWRGAAYACTRDL